MHPKRWTFRLVCGLTLLAAGCASPYPHSPYGQGGYPGVYGTPPQGPVIVPQGGLPGGTQYNPQVPGYQGSSAPQWRQSSDAGTLQPVPSDAPLFKSNSAGRVSPQNENPVPDYQDPSAFQEPATGDPQSGGAASPFSSKAEPGVEFEAVAQRSRVSPTKFDPFEAPVPVQAVATSRQLPLTETAARQPNPYDYDRADYRWLRGIVDYDEEDRSWNVIYSMDPDPNDDFGGSITLISDNRFQVLKNGDVVYIEGRIAADSPDQYGKPRYRVDHLAPLVAKKQ